jgi:hypothetical protein
LWATREGVLLVLAIASSAIAWWMIARPVFSLSNTASHRGHFVPTFAHAIGGTGMLALGGVNLYLAAAKSHYPLHRRVGQSYLAFGTFASLVAIAVTLTMAHKAAGTSIFTNVTVSLLTLASPLRHWAGAPREIAAFSRTGNG